MDKYVSLLKRPLSAEMQNWQRSEWKRPARWWLHHSVSPASTIFQLSLMTMRFADDRS
jgi:hypothetical protein